MAYFSKRSSQKELMDDPESDRGLLYKTLKQFEQINRFFLSTQRLTRKIMLPTMLESPDRPLRILDVGCGGGDFALWLDHQLKKRGVPVEITGIDVDERIVEYAKKAVKAHKNICVIQRDAFEIGKFTEDFDYIFCSNFLHHLSDEEIDQMLPMIFQRCLRGLLVVDLRRSAPAYFLFCIFLALFLRGSFAQVDGRISIQRGFLPKELEEIVRRSPSGRDVKVKRAGISELSFFWKAK